MCCEECIRMHNSSSQFQWLHRTNGVAQSGRLSRTHTFHIGVPHHAKMRRCGGSRWDTATHLLLEQLNSHKNSTAASWWDSRFGERFSIDVFCLAFFHHVSWQGFFHHVSWELHVYVLHSVSCDVLWDLALRRRRLLWQSALQPQSRPWRVTAACHSPFPADYEWWHRAWAERITPKPMVAHRCSSFSYIFPIKNCYVGLQPNFRHTHVSPRRQQTTRSRVQWS